MPHVRLYCSSEEDFASSAVDTDEELHRQEPQPPFQGATCTKALYICTHSSNVYPLSESPTFQTTSPPAFSAGCEKVVVSFPQLIQLLPEHCYIEKCTATLSTWQQYKGGVLVLKFSCSAGHHYMWSSSAESVSACGNSIHTNNILIAAACILSGNSFEKLKQMCKFMGLVTITNRTFYK